MSSSSFFFAFFIALATTRNYKLNPNEHRTFGLGRWDARIANIILATVVIRLMLMLIRNMGRDHVDRDGGQDVSDGDDVADNNDDDDDVMMIVMMILTMLMTIVVIDHVDDDADNDDNDWR